MANTIQTNYSMFYRNAGQSGKTAAGKGDSAEKAKDLAERYGADFSVELSGEGLAALAKQRKTPVGDAGEGKGAVKEGEAKLSAKAQDFLAKLKEQYGDYDFFVADDVNDPSFRNRGTKQYSVILRTDELEKMANDEAYAEEVMGKVNDAVDMTKRIEEKGELGEGVRFRRIAISFDDDGNMKLFADLEKISEQQKERMEAAKEKHAREQKDADKKAEKDGSHVKHARLEASSEEELLEKLLGLDWDKIPEDKQKERQKGFDRKL